MVADETRNKRPNIALVIADDMSSKDWGIYGDTLAKMPHIDRAAAEGVWFTNAYHAPPVCHPSRSALLTGQDIWRLRDAAVFAGTLHNTLDTYPPILREAGYTVAHSGKGGSQASRSQAGGCFLRREKLPVCRKFWPMQRVTTDRSASGGERPWVIGSWTTSRMAVPWT